MKLHTYNDFNIAQKPERWTLKDQSPWNLSEPQEKATTWSIIMEGGGREDDPEKSHGLQREVHTR